MGFPLISQGLHTPPGQTGCRKPEISLPMLSEKEERKSKEGGREGWKGEGVWSDSQGHLNKHKPDAEHVEHVCGHGQECVDKCF